MANQFLIKDTMSDMRAISTSEINDLQANIYEGVLLLGYYAKDDTPTPIIYYISGTLEADDGGSIIEVGEVKLEHKFTNKVNVRYFGASSNKDNNIESIQNAINSCNYIEISDALHIIIEEVVSDDIKKSNSLKIEGSKTIDFTADGRIVYGIALGDTQYPAFIIIDNMANRVNIIDAIFEYNGDFGKENTPDNNKWGLGILSSHFSSHIFTYNSEVNISNIKFYGTTQDNVINSCISVHHSRCTINNAEFDDYCIGVMASRKNFNVITDYLNINNITGGRQSQKALLVYGPGHLIYMNGHANFQATNVFDKGLLTVYNGDEPMFDGNPFNPFSDGHTFKINNIIGGCTVTGVISHRMEGILDVIGTSDRSSFKNLHWEIEDFTRGYYNWGAIRVDRGTTGIETPINIEATLKMKGGDRKFVEFRADLSNIKAIIEHSPIETPIQPVLIGNIIKDSDVNITYKNTTEYQPQLLYIDRTCTNNIFKIIIKGSRNIGGIGFNVSGVSAPTNNIIRIVGVDAIDVSKIQESENTTTPLSILRNNRIYTGDNGDKMCFKFSNGITSSGSSLNLNIPFLPLYNNSIDYINITAVAAGDFYIFSQDFKIKKFGGNTSTFNTLLVESLGWVINGTIITFNSGDGESPSIGDIISIGEVSAKIKQITINSGSFEEGTAQGTFSIEHYNRINPSITEITGNNFTSTMSNKNNSIYEGISIINNASGLNLTNTFPRTSARSYVLYLNILNSQNTRT